MNILVISDIVKKTHTDRPEISLYLQWAEAGHKVIICVPDTEYQDAYRDSNIKILNIEITGKISLSAISKIRKQLATEAYDIIYTTGSRTIPIAAFSSIGFNTKVVCYRGTTSGLYRHDPMSYLTILHPRVNAVVCVSNAVKEVVDKRLVKRSVVTKTIYKGHDLNWYTEPPADLQQFNIPATAFVVTSVANFRPKKGLDVLLRAASELADIENLHLVIVGPGADAKNYTKLVINSGMQTRIHRIGQSPDAARFIAASNLYAQCSIKGEGLPRTVMESLAYGIPVVTSTAGGAKEIIRESENGYVVPANDPIALATRIRTCHTNIEQLKSMAEICKNTVSGRLSTQHNAQQHVDLFQSLLEKH